MSGKPTQAQRNGAKGASFAYVTLRLRVSLSEAQAAVAERTDRGTTHDVFRRENVRLWKLALRAVRTLGRRR